MILCKKCGTRINFIRTIKGKNMPVDVELITVITKDGLVVKGYIPHWATCPNADDFRRKK